MAIHINIFGAPGSGKSTFRSLLFYNLKIKHLKVEEITEVAKDDTYNERYLDLSDQIQLFGKQHHNHFILDKVVDYIVTDSPFIMGFNYVPKQGISYSKELKDLMLKVHNSYDSINFLIEQDHEYQTYGRNQTELESKQKAIEIEKFLETNKINFVKVKSSDDFIAVALETLETLDTPHI